MKVEEKAQTEEAEIILLEVYVAITPSMAIGMLAFAGVCLFVCYRVTPCGAQGLFLA